MFASFLFCLFSFNLFFSYLLCHSFPRLLLLLIYPSLFLSFVRCFIKFIYPQFFSILFHLHCVSFLLSPSLCHFLFFTTVFSVCPLMHSIHHRDLLSDPQKPVGGDKFSTKLKADYAFFLKWEDEERENKSPSTFKGLLVLAPKERKGYPSNFKGLPFCLEKWTMAKKKTKSALQVGVY